MKRLILMPIGILLSLSLTGCHSTMNNAGQAANATVGTGVKYGVRTVGTGVGVVTNAGAAVADGVGNVASAGVSLVTGQPRIVYKNGHRYQMMNGRYVMVR